MGLIYTLLSILMFNLNIGSDAIPYASIESAFASGDASKIVSYGKDRMIVNVIEKEGVYSQIQAEQVLKEFFGKKPASSFSLLSKGKKPTMVVLRSVRMLFPKQRITGLPSNGKRAAVTLRSRVSP